MKNTKSIFIYPKYSCLITQSINVTFTIRDCSRSAAACHNLALPPRRRVAFAPPSGKTMMATRGPERRRGRSGEHTSELPSLRHLVCPLLLLKKKRETARRLFSAEHPE